MGTRTEMDMKVMYREGIREMNTLVRLLRMGPYPPITREVRCWHPGGTDLFSDASGSFQNCKSGWGILVQDIFMTKPWTEVTLKSLADGIV